MSRIGLLKNSAYIEAFLLFSLIPAYYVWGSILRTACSFILALFLISDIILHGSNKHKIIPTIFTVLYIYIAFLSGKNILGVLFSITTPILFFVRPIYLKNILNSFRNIYALVTAISLVVYICVVYVGVNLPYKTISPLNDLKNSYYSVYPFFVQYQTVLSGFRFSCLFDEPGVVGTISALLLLLDNFNLKKWQNIVILISGIFSFSFFFYVLSAVYLIVTAPAKYKLLSLIIIIITIYLLRDNDVVNSLVISRFEFNDGSFVGDNRVGLGFDSFYENFKKSNKFLFGLGPGMASKIDPEGSSYKHVVVDYGIIFFIIYMASFMGYSLSVLKRIKPLLIYSICVFGTMYQRPFINQPTLILILIASIYTLNNVNNSKQHR